MITYSDIDQEISKAFEKWVNELSNLNKEELKKAEAIKDKLNKIELSDPMNHAQLRSFSDNTLDHLIEWYKSPVYPDQQQIIDFIIRIKSEISTIKEEFDDLKEILKNTGNESAANEIKELIQSLAT